MLNTLLISKALRTMKVLSQHPEWLQAFVSDNTLASRLISLLTSEAIVVRVPYRSQFFEQETVRAYCKSVPHSPPPSPCDDRLLRSLLDAAGSVTAPGICGRGSDPRY